MKNVKGNMDMVALENLVKTRHIRNSSRKREKKNIEKLGHVTCRFRQVQSLVGLYTWSFVMSHMDHSRKGLNNKAQTSKNYLLYITITTTKFSFSGP